MKKAFDWLQENNVSYVFHDYKKQGLSDDKAKEFIENIALEKLINRKGTTWKKLTLQQQNSISDDKKAMALMQDNTSLIKRPIIAYDGGYLLGFDDVDYQILKK